MDKLFLDANVLFSAAYRDTSPLLRLWDMEGVVLLTSFYALEEARRNIALARPQAVPVLEGLTAKLRVLSESQSCLDLPELPTLPEKDRPILLAAIVHGATHLLTGDKEHFGHLFGRSVRGVLVVTPATYLASSRCGAG